VTEGGKTKSSTRSDPEKESGEDPEILKGLPEKWATVSRGPKKFQLRHGGWGELMVRYAGMGPARPLENIFKETVGPERPTLAQLESGYIDEDFRDEYANFYAKTYRELPTRCERLHFFDDVDESDPKYLGYVVIRPILGRPVSRTMLVPPAALKEHVSCLASGSATPWGYPLEVDGFPFISQDSQFGSCAHAAIWMVALYFHLRFRAPRYHLSDLAQSARMHQDVHPALPSGGLTGMQISAVLHDLDMTPVIYPIDEGIPDDAESIACRYLNSGLPVILLNETKQSGHAKVLIGYGRDEQGLFFIHHDDQLGPYRTTRKLVPTAEEDSDNGNGAGNDACGQEKKGSAPDSDSATVSDAAQADSDTHAQGNGTSLGWNALVVPMPGRIYLSGEAAERWGRFVFEELIDEYNHLKHLAGGLEEGRLRLRCYVAEAAHYMRELRKRQPSEDVVVWHTGIPASHWLWIVELQDREAASRSSECVIGEVAIDATSDDNWVNPLFGNLPELTLRWPDLGEEIDVGESTQNCTPYTSGCALHVAS
jgi:hypothetical protein